MIGLVADQAIMGNPSLGFINLADLFASGCTDLRRSSVGNAETWARLKRSDTTYFLHEELLSERIIHYL